MEPNAVTRSPSGIEEGWVYYVQSILLIAKSPVLHYYCCVARLWARVEKYPELPIVTSAVCLIFLVCACFDSSVTAEWYGLMYLRYVSILNITYTIICVCLLFTLSVHACLLLSVFLLPWNLCFTSRIWSCMVHFCMNHDRIILFMQSLYCCKHYLKGV